MLGFIVLGAIAFLAVNKSKDGNTRTNSVSKPTAPTNRKSQDREFEEDTEDDLYDSGDYISECAEEWGMSTEQVENQLGLDKD
jgi:hypothetical protein